MHPTNKQHVVSALLFLLPLALAAPQAAAGGTAGFEFKSYNGRSARPGDSDLNIQRDGYFGAYCASGSTPGSRSITYPLDVPHDHNLLGVQVWGVDSSASNNLNYELVETCMPFLSGGTPTYNVLASSGTSGSAGNFSLYVTGVQGPALNATCAYFLQARFAAFGSSCDGFDLILHKVRLVTDDPDVIFRSNLGS